MDVDDLYNQTMVGALHQYKINDTTNFSSQLRYYRSRDDGQAKAGLVDNDLYHAH